jgi:hypothetical protein
MKFSSEQKIIIRQRMQKWTYDCIGTGYVPLVLVATNEQDQVTLLAVDTLDAQDLKNLFRGLSDDDLQEKSRER